MTSGVGKNDGGAKAGAAPRPRHHVDDAMLLAYAAGTLEQSASIVVAAHVSLCPHCRNAVKIAETAGGVLLADVPPEAMSATALDSILHRLDEPAAPLPAVPEIQTVLGVALPRVLNAYLPQRLRWRWVSPGVKFAHLLTGAGGAKLGFMYAAAASRIAAHGHTGDEMTLVLGGGFRDAGASFVRGDLQTTGEDIVHRPVADRDSDCLLLLMVRGSIRPTSLLGRLFLPFTGF